MTNNIFFMLVGLPGVGKSTWVDQQNNIFFNQKIQILSTDKIIEQIATITELSYNDVYGNISYAFAEKMIHHLAPKIFKRNDIVIWDQVNLTVKSRARKLELVPLHWQKVAVVFDIPDDHDERLSNRDGKTIPKKVLDEMKEKFEYPSLSEGFNFVRKA